MRSNAQWPMSPAHISSTCFGQNTQWVSCTLNLPYHLVSINLFPIAVLELFTSLTVCFPMYFYIWQTRSCRGSPTNSFSAFLKTSLLRRLQGQTLPDATTPMGQIHPFSKMAVTFVPLNRFWCPLGFRKSFSLWHSLFYNWKCYLCKLLRRS